MLERLLLQKKVGREVGGGDIKGAKSEQKGTAARSRLKEGNIGVLQNILKGIRYPSEGECGGLWGGGGENMAKRGLLTNRRRRPRPRVVKVEEGN